jgi:hypothetical protein
VIEHVISGQIEIIEAAGLKQIFFEAMGTQGPGKNSQKAK